MTEETDEILTRLPARLKEARTAQGLSLEAVANLSGVSRSMVSQIERGESSPTISTLWNLTQALQVDFAGLLDNDEAEDRIELLQGADVPKIENMGHGCRIHILSPPSDAGSHEVYDISFQASGTLRSNPHVRGTQEQLTVLEGSVVVESGTAVERVSAGDTARYSADIPHAILAENGPARVFLIVKSR